MRLTILLAFSLITVLNTSCKRLILMQYGVKQPQIESNSSITEFLIKKDMNVKDVLCFKDSAAMSRKVLDERLSIPEVYFYNKNGHFVTYKAAAVSCTASASPFLDNLADNFNTLPFDTSRHISKEFSYLYRLNNQNAVNFDDFEKSDVYVVMYFVKYIGKLNKESIWDWLNHIKLIESKTKFKITPILVSGDYMDFWGISKESLPKFRL